MIKTSEKCCVYILNESPLYHAMYSVSVRMLRLHNPDMKIILYYVLDSNSDSWSESNSLYGQIDSDNAKRYMLLNRLEIEELSAKMGVEVRVRMLMHRSQNYAPIQRSLLYDLEFTDVLLLDVDTFFFGDISRVFSFLPDKDFIACPMVGINKGENSIEKHKMMFTYRRQDSVVKEVVKPFNSGVVLWRRSLLSEYARYVLGCCNELLHKKHPMSDMMYALREDARSREEIACNLFVLENGLSASMFDPNDVAIAEYRENLCILHSSSAGFPYFFSKFAHEGKLVPN